MSLCTPQQVVYIVKLMQVMVDTHDDNEASGALNEILKYLMEMVGDPPPGDGPAQQPMDDMSGRYARAHRGSFL